MKAYVYDTEDLKLDPTYQETWDDMIINVSLFNFCERKRKHLSELKFLYHIIKVWSIYYF